MTSHPSAVVLPIDGSDGALRAVEAAGVLAQQFGVELQLVYVFSHEAVDPFGLNALGQTGKSADFIDPDLLAQIQQEKATTVFRQAEARLEAISGLSVVEVTLKGDPATQLLDYLAQQAAPWVVMGRQGKSTLKEIFIGSVSQKLIHRAGCPVTLIN